MLTEYKGEIFNVEKNADSVSIWKYIPIKGFEKHTTRRGITYYEKVIKMEDVGELFDITFRALMNDKEFIVKSMNNRKIDVICDDYEYSKANGFSEMEHGVWSKRFPIDAFSEFHLVKSVENSKQKEVKMLSVKEFIDAWRKYVIGVEAWSTCRDAGIIANYGKAKID